ncbi:MAG: hypothetical protein A3B91_04120 [Candidatus Yanofskybacteria bacterium RIFCSPHIGHO2_02_FULL_41_29]|uniref:PDZ domain-containing protein n=1 Tax=Candidatus Yanofskybacteria bacterium RIFCSPHIGHO2_01_FULL_41_53 TaxID=1802663 RepID=A0A1F8EF35_9BACT|nr:MAG: hypothetical protein A2650_02835 [Candidatus Yanofskybacteria bacterium RIFCSPHIGHO2_01_FULL_41_53]OGN10487.1 MAG: hypothetical protein A3B91_04120 [Candidatus Yanofskybacteria bacterium RIFCSPHIGHO2_02_FULL_41_29]OGN18047.1 MAG: hypothetical protein A3F48_00035 [Candidatus Yanofskybacteria bacterium RIFCSPHIGHO2_12_FULL_41_9]OGN21534.1 MAG: hypothetical protein A2916_04600 [Candidatus Yanofskybacteria bacterium RIFCSPLOWO2_01_FULL_41_67]OGN29674.1 MAG: hypothetical protein A3H54_02820 
MKNNIRNQTLSFILVLIFIFCGHSISAQTTVPQPQGQVPAQTAVSSEAQELEFKRQELLKLISSISDPASLQKLFDFFLVQNEVLAHYVDTKSFIEVLDLGMIGMVEGLDPYSHLFIDEKAEALYKNFSEEANYVGVGMVLMEFHKNIFVVEVIEDSPALKAGIEPGDSILKVDGKSVYGLQTSEVRDMVIGKDGTSVSIEIRSARLQKLKTMNIVRQQVVIKSVIYKELGKDIVYVKIRSFLPEDEVVDRFREVLDRTAGRKLIIDLRGNGGGSLRAVNQMVGFLVGPDNLLITSRGRDSTVSIMTPGDINFPPSPSKIAVLTNNFSASASEIMAGTLKYYKKATIVGTRTYGKATVQNYLGLDKPLHMIGGSRLIMGITIERYFLPDGTNITGSGVQPDIEIEQPDDFKQFQFLTKKDAQFQAALKFLKSK